MIFGARARREGCASRSPGPGRPSGLLRRGHTRGRIAGTWVLNAEEQSFAGLARATIDTELLLDDGAVQQLVDPGLRKLMSSVDTAARVGRFELVPAERAMVDGAPQLPGPMEIAERARNNPGKYAGLAGWVIERALADGSRLLKEVEDKGLVSSWDQPDSLRSLRTALVHLLPGLRLRGVAAGDLGHRVAVLAARASPRSGAPTA